MTHIQISQIVRDRTRPTTLKSAAIVVGPGTRPGQWRICRWRGGYKQHWSLPVSIDERQLELIADWTLMPLTEAKRLAATAYERNYLVRVNRGWDREVIVIMVITEVRANHGGQGAHRYWGADDHGVAYGAYEDQIRGHASSLPAESKGLTLDEYQEKSTGGLSLSDAERLYKESLE